MDYLTLILGFFAVVVSVRGNTWDKKQCGIKKITLTGWAALTNALISSLIAGQGICKRVIARDIIQQHSRLYVKASLQEILAPFWSLYTKYAMSRGLLDTTKEFRTSGYRNAFDYKRRQTPMDKLLEPSFVEYLQSTDLTRYLHELSLIYKSPYGSAGSGLKRIRDILTIFQNELDVSLRATLLTIIDPNGFVESLKNRKEPKCTAPKMPSRLKHHVEMYQEFIKACLKVLEQLPDEEVGLMESAH